jgi:hypothetical protein
VQRVRDGVHVERLVQQLYVLALAVVHSSGDQAVLPLHVLYHGGVLHELQNGLLLQALLGQGAVGDAQGTGLYLQVLIELLLQLNLLLHQSRLHKGQPADLVETPSQDILLGQGKISGNERGHGGYDAGDEQ